MALFPTDYSDVTVVTTTVKSPKTSADYIAYINSVKAHLLDATWNADGGTNNWYTTNSLGLGYYVPYTWLNVFMVQVIAIFAGRGIATATDISRANLVLAKLVASPCYVNATWTHSMLGTSDYHPAVDQPVSECLYYAYKNRVALGLSAGLITSIYNILTVSYATTSVYEDGYTLSNATTKNGQSLSKWLTNKMTYAYLTGNTSLASAISAGIKRFIYYMDKPTGGATENTTHFLFPDFGWRYVDSMAFHSLEYGEMCFGAGILLYPEISSVFALTSDEILKYKAWQRGMLGMWQKNGYPNWDTGWSNGRIHSLSYWLWSIRALLGMARNVGLNMGVNDYKYAKYLLDNSIDTMQHMDWWNNDVYPDSSVSRQPFAVQFPVDVFEGTIKYNNVKESGMAKYCMELALAVDFGVADAVSLEPTNIWGWNWFSQDLHISTSTYSAASLPWAPAITYAGSNSVQGPGDGISRLQLPTNEVLTNVGGYGQQAFSFLIKKNSVTEIDTGLSTTGKPYSQLIYKDGVLQTRTDYDTQAIDTSFSTSIKSIVTRNGSNYRSVVETEFFNTYINWKHSVTLTGTVGTGQAVISVPCVKNCVMEYIPVTGAKTIIWDGITALTAGSIDPTVCKYIHLKWAQWGAGVLLKPISGTVASDSQVASFSFTPTYPLRQPNQDRSLLIYLATAVASMGNLNLQLKVIFTDGTDANAVLLGI